MIDVLKKRYTIINYDGRSNYHTHTFYCDGKNSPEEMVTSAIAIGFRGLGFSGHQFSEQDASYAMSAEDEKKYCEDILLLKKKYADKMHIYLGLERDFCSEETSGYDYIIGSTHHVKVNDVWTNVDESPQVMNKEVEELFSGDYMAYADAYYKQEGDVLLKTKGQIVGHFDLITVFNENNEGGYVYLDESDPAYKKLAISSVDRIVESYLASGMSRSLPSKFPEELGEIIDKTGMPIFEINTGAMAKGRKKKPYPAPFIIEHLADMGVPMVLNSDCHDCNYLDFGFNEVINEYSK